MSEEQAEYLTDALEMIGSGYAAVEIEHPRTVIQRREGKLQSIDKPAFIKLSTSFKSELAGISGDALKVWIFISLSINRKSERANPGLRTIANGVGLAVNTVQKALKELESVNLLAVYRGERRYNLYEVPEYVSANKSDPTVSNRDTDSETVSNSGETVSNSVQTVSPSVILNQSNQSNQNGGKPPIDPSALPIDWQMLGDKPVVLPDEKLAKQKDAAALVGMGMGVLAEPAAALVLAFQVERGVVFTESQIKGQRKAAKALIEQKITPALVTAAVKKLQAAGMTVTDLYSITKTAIDLANKTETPKTGRSLPEIG